MEPVTAARTPLDRAGQGRAAEENALQLRAGHCQLFRALCKYSRKFMSPCHLTGGKSSGRHSQASSAMSFQFGLYVCYISIFFLAPGPVSSSPSPPSLLPPMEVIFFSLLVFFSLFARGHERYFPSNHSVLDTSTALLPHPPTSCGIPLILPSMDLTCLGQEWTYVGSYESRAVWTVAKLGISCSLGVMAEFIPATYR